MVRRILPSQFNRVAQFGTLSSTEKPNTGSYDPTFVPQIVLHVCPSKRSITQQYQVMGTTLEDTIVIIIRHNPKVNKSLQVSYGGQRYAILDISQDDSFNINTYDYLTLKLTEKAGS